MKPISSCYCLIPIISSLLLPVIWGAEFEEVATNITDTDSISVSIFFFGVKTTGTAFHHGSNILLHCEYAAPPGREVEHIGIAKYDIDEVSSTYELLCGRTEGGKELYMYNRTTKIETDDEKLVVVHVSSMTPDSCIALPKQKGGVLFELRKVSDADVGDFACKVHLRDEVGASYKYSRKIRNNGCTEGIQSRCTEIEPETLKLCPVTCEHQCRPLGVGWICVCNAGYRLADDKIHCDFINM